MAESRFPDGFIAKRPHTNAPHFVKAKISIKKDEFLKWLQSEDGEWVNLEIKESKNSKYYAVVNDWKPETADVPDGTATKVKRINDVPQPGEEINPEDIPF